MGGPAFRDADPAPGLDGSAFRDAGTAFRGAEPAVRGDGSGFRGGVEVEAGVEPVRAAGAVPITYGKYDGRPSAPSPEVFDELAAVYRVTLPAWAGELDTVLRIDWAGDAGRLEIDGRAVTDRFWDGSAWLVNLRDAGYRPGAEVTLHLLPLATASPVALPHDARDRLIAAEGQLLAVDGIRVLGLATYREEPA